MLVGDNWKNFVIAGLGTAFVVSLGYVLTAVKETKGEQHNMLLRLSLAEAEINRRQEDLTSLHAEVRNLNQAQQAVLQRPCK